MTTHSLHTLIGSLSPEAFSYFFPGFSAPHEVIGKELRREDDGGVRFKVSEKARSLPEISLKDVLSTPPPQSKRQQKLKVKEPGKLELKWRKITRSVEKWYENAAEDNAEDTPVEFHVSETPAPVVSGEVVAEPEPDERTQALLDELEALKRKYGVTSAELEALLGRNVKMSRLRITARKEVILEDYGRKEVRMDDLSKAVFLLYLRHPEGIRYKDLQDHRDELERIYMSITGRSELADIRRSVDALVDPYSNSINEKVSKVKRAFRDVVDDRVAKLYYIDGGRGEARRIAMERADVIWD